MSANDIIIVDINVRILNGLIRGVFIINVRKYEGAKMANKPTRKVPVNKEHFLEVLKFKNCSIRKLGEAYDKIERTEKTIRRCLNSGKMPADLLNKIAKFLDVHPDYLSGAYHEKADKIEDAYLRMLYRSSIKPEKHPYLLKLKSEIGYKSYFENILTMNDISMEMFQALPPMERVMFRQKLVVAILRVITEHFTHDALGNDLSETLLYCESMVGDFDPFSYFANLESIGLSEFELNGFIDDDSITDSERQLHDKYKCIEP